MDKHKLGRYLTRGIFGFLMIGLALTIQPDATERSIVYVIEAFTIVTIPALQAAFVIGGAGLWFLPTRRMEFLFPFTIPALFYVLVAIGGSITGELLPQAGISNAVTYAALLLFYWICS